MCVCVRFFPRLTLITAVCECVMTSSTQVKSKIFGFASHLSCCRILYFIRCNATITIRHIKYSLKSYLFTMNVVSPPLLSLSLLADALQSNEWHFDFQWYAIRIFISTLFTFIWRGKKRRVLYIYRHIKHNIVVICIDSPFPKKWI